MGAVEALVLTEVWVWPLSYRVQYETGVVTRHSTVLVVPRGFVTSLLSRGLLLRLRGSTRPKLALYTRERFLD